MGGTRNRRPLDFTFRLVPLVLRLLQQKGIDGRPLAAQAGLPAGFDTAPEITAPLPRFRTFLDAAAAALRDDQFGLTLSHAVPKGTYALVEFISRSAGTPREAMESLARFGRIINAGVDWVFVQRQGFGVLEHHVPAETEGLGRVLNEYTMAFVARACAEAVGEKWKLKRLYFAHPAPADAAPLTKYFGISPTFGTGVSGMEIPDDVLSQPMASADPALKRFLEEQGRTVLETRPASTDLVGVIRQELVRRLGKTEAKVETVADALEMSPRTLQRRLEGEGTSFQEVLDGVREQLAMSYLVNDSLTVSEIAYLLGYSELRAFDRAFRRWTGKTPVAWRNTRKQK
ncbi:MAG: AraC family transcriptional regulator ligand-binding domain-containing protein [Myxococcaceae bacterium]|nr:AraC family transcriptional regulator ligand-binding domain-containing protein [Myxococcaceae bacterium]